MAIGLDEVLDDLNSTGRVCPQPAPWREMYKLLPYRQRTADGWEPPLPFMRVAWWSVPDQEKKARFVRHLEWADRYGVLDTVQAFLSALPEEAWHRGAMG